MAGWAHSKDSVVRLDGPNSCNVLAPFNISAYVTGVEGLPGEAELSEITVLLVFVLVAANATPHA